MRTFQQRDVDAMVGATLSSGSGSGSMLDFETLRQKAQFELASKVTNVDGTTSSSLQAGGILAPILRDLLKKSPAHETTPDEVADGGDNNKKNQKNGNGDSGDDHSDGDDEQEVGAPSKKSWLDPSKLAKTQREQAGALDTFEKESLAMVKEMEDASALFKKDKDSSRFVSELRILEVRRQALDLVLQNDPNTLRDFMCKFGSEAPPAEAAASARASESSSWTWVNCMLLAVVRTTRR